MGRKNSGVSGFVSPHVLHVRWSRDRSGRPPRLRKARHALHRPYTYCVPLMGVNASSGLVSPQVLHVRMEQAVFTDQVGQGGSQRPSGSGRQRTKRAGCLSHRPASRSV